MAVLVDVLLLFMLTNTSSIFELNMLVAVEIMFIILELIVEIMPNNPTRVTLEWTTNEHNYPPT